jgi:hypothetical protein
LRELGWFVVPTGLVIGAAGLAIFLISARLREDDVQTQRTLLLSTLVLLGLTSLLRVLDDGWARPAGGDAQLRRLAAAAIPVYLAALYLPPAADFFQLTPLGLAEWGLVLAAVGPAYVLLRWTDRWLRRTEKVSR